jgi:hypothetical protein
MFKEGQKVVFVNDGKSVNPDCIHPKDNEIVTIKLFVSVCPCGCGENAYQLLEYPNDKFNRNQAFAQGSLRPIENAFKEKDRLERIVYVTVAPEVKELIKELHLS